MKRVLSLFLVMSILGQATVRSLWTLHYQWNRAIYLQFCENRNKPELHCDGKCYLEKRITGQDDKAPKAPRLPESFRQMQDILLFCETASLPVFNTPEAAVEIQFPPCQNHPADAHPGAVFRPPATV